MDNRNAWSLSYPNDCIVMLQPLGRGFSNLSKALSQKSRFIGLQENKKYPALAVVVKIDFRWNYD